MMMNSKYCSDRSTQEISYPQPSNIASKGNRHE
jgi:hypothetical protein